MFTAADVAAAAIAFDISLRTVYRWINAGVDIRSAEAVAQHLLEQHAPSPAAMQAALEIITSKSSTHENTDP
jgi:transposase